MTNPAVQRTARVEMQIERKYHTSFDQCTHNAAVACLISDGACGIESGARIATRCSSVSPITSRGPRRVRWALADDDTCA
jgi:hypothetical protein